MNKLGGRVDFLKNIDFNDNKIRIAIVLILVVILVVFLKWKRTTKGGGKISRLFEKLGSKKSKMVGKKSGKKSGKRSTKKQSKREIRRSARNTTHSSGDENFEDGVEDNFDDSESSEDAGDGAISAALRSDAEELYGLVHEGLAKGIQQDEFERIAGEFADEYSFIELKQLYNSHIDRNLDPIKTITVTDYIRILQKEDEDF